MIVGIDLGTTHSLIGAYLDNGPELFKNPLGELLTPSIIGMDEQNTLLVGAIAKERLITHPQQTIANFKRWMGSARKIQLNNKVFGPEELSALVLRSLIADAEAATGQKVTEAVISVPAYFSDAQRKATKIAGELAGIKVERLINEPTAAALAYGLQARKEGGKFLLLDLGGGTFDVSILEIFDGVVEVHASAGDNFLGGEDFLQVLFSTFCSETGIALDKLNAIELGSLLAKLEQLKKNLTTNASHELDISLNAQSYHWQITAEHFANLCEPLIQRMRAPIERAVRDAKLKANELDEVILVGGASRMPMISRLVSKLFGRLPLRHINPDQTIAIGAVIAASLKVRDERLEEIILTDICPYTLGTNVCRKKSEGNYAEGYFMPIIARNSTVPISREENLYPVYDDQENITVEVYQGESPTIDKNIKLGELHVKLPNKLANNRGVTVRFTYDINGILQVETKVIETGETQQLILKQNENNLTEAEIMARLQALDELKIHPREKQENVLLLARAARLYEELIDYREMLQNWILQFEQILDKQDNELIIEARKEFSSNLDHLEKNY